MTHPALQHLPKGWFHHGEQLLALLEQHRPAVVVELGTYLGASAIAMARVLAPWGGVIYCVDTWYGKPVRGKRWPMRLFACATNLIIADVNASVRLIPAKTADAARAWRGPAIDVLYVDADHREAGVLADLRDWWPHVRSGGLIAGDDYDHPAYPGLNVALDAFEAESGMALQRVLTPETTPPDLRFVYGVKP